MTPSGAPVNGMALGVGYRGPFLPLRSVVYIYPCSTGGKCQRIMFEKWGFAWYESYPKNGFVNVWTDKGHGFDAYRGKYKCCTRCHLPLNQFEATKANSLYGYTLDEEVFDDEFMELLNGQ